MHTHLNRRAFLRLAGLGGLALGSTACGLADEVERLLASPTPVTPIPWPTKTPAPFSNLWPDEAGLASPLLVDNPPLAFKDPATAESWQDFPLQRLVGRDFFGQLSTPLAELGLNLQPGHDYLLSYYVRSASPEEVLFWMRPLASMQAYGHGPKLAGVQVRRAWQVVRALGPRQVAEIRDPARPLEEQTSDTLTWLFQGASNDGWQVDLRLGGFMLEDLGEFGEAGLRQGVAVMGDSTTEGFSAGTDHPLSREWSTHAAARLNVPFYNRAHHGWTTGRMREEWEARITPLAWLCRWCLLQGGLNDLALGQSTTVIQDNFRWMWDRAEASGMLPVVATITPYNVIVNAGQEGNRQALNEWIRSTFVRVLDFDLVVRDPADPSSLRREDGWFGDGGHFDRQAKRAIGEYVAAWEGWDFVQPNAYIP